MSDHVPHSVAPALNAARTPAPSPCAAMTSRNSTPTSVGGTSVDVTTPARAMSMKRTASSPG
jgi:hypothetical protein